MPQTFVPTEASLVRDIAARLPGATRVFDALRIDYCCGGMRPLAAACGAASIRVDDVLARLATESSRAEEGREESARWTDAPLEQLIDHLLATHHVFGREALAHLTPLVEKVWTRHAEAHPELDEVRSLFRALAVDLEPHFVREEMVLFPYLRSLVAAAARGDAPPSGCFGELSAPVSVMEADHDAVGTLLHRLREVTSGYAAPAGACGSYGALYTGLAELDRDLVQHVHLENNVLFPRALALFERTRSGARA